MLCCWDCPVYAGYLEVSLVSAHWMLGASTPHFWQRKLSSNIAKCLLQRLLGWKTITFSHQKIFLSPIKQQSFRGDSELIIIRYLLRRQLFFPIVTWMKTIKAPSIHILLSATKHTVISHPPAKKYIHHPLKLKRLLARGQMPNRLLPELPLWSTQAASLQNLWVTAAAAVQGHSVPEALQQGSLQHQTSCNIPSHHWMADACFRAFRSARGRVIRELCGPATLNKEQR